MKQKVERLREKIHLDASRASPYIDEELHHDLQQTIADNDDKVTREFPEGTFQRVFWEQQKKSAALHNSRSMKWHPLFIKWCIYLHHVSGKGYNMLRDSGCIQLPSQRTLRDYTHYISAGIGFSAEVDKQLRDSIDTSEEKNRYRYVALVMDEVHIKDDLVYDKHNFALIGFQNLGDINNHLLKYEASLTADHDDECLNTPPLAKTMLVFMVRGLFTKLAFPYSQFACSSITGDLLFDPMWEAISRLERQDIRVLVITCDGASVNCRLWKVHATKDGDEITHKVTNIFANPTRPLFSISDPPHLLKTIRNCWWSSKRMLWCNGKQISWSHLVDLYNRDTKCGQQVTGLRLVPKLKYEHICLSSFSKMRVDLAAEVLSETVSKAMQMTGGEEVSETVRFISMMDRFFDCLNVNNFTVGKRKRKSFQDPYRSSNDFRLKWLQEEFLTYLDEWEQSVAQRPSFMAKEKNKMLLSAETRYGIKATVRSFIELVKFIFTIPGVNVFLSESISQDVLENFFGCQRQRGGTADNPNVAQFLKNTSALRVIDNVCVNVSHAGNCRGRKKRQNPIETSNDHLPLPKRRRHHK